MEKQLIWIWFFALVLISLGAAGDVVIPEKKSESSKEATLLGEVTASYRDAALVEVPVEKRIKTEWKNKEDVSLGKMFYSHGKVRWEIVKPEKTWTIYNGKTWWNVEFASEDFPGSKNKVTISVVDKKHKDQFFVLDLLAAKDPSEQFLVTTKDVGDKDNVTLLLKPKKKADFTDIQVTVSKEKKSIGEISFKDDIGNIVDIKLGAPEMKKTGDAKLFNYKPDLKKDQVSNL